MYFDLLRFGKLKLHITVGKINMGDFFVLMARSFRDTSDPDIRLKSSLKTLARDSIRRQNIASNDTSAKETLSIPLSYLRNKLMNGGEPLTVEETDEFTDELSRRGYVTKDNDITVKNLMKVLCADIVWPTVTNLRNLGGDEDEEDEENLEDEIQTIISSNADNFDGIKNPSVAEDIEEPIQEEPVVEETKSESARSHKSFRSTKSHHSHTTTPRNYRKSFKKSVSTKDLEGNDNNFWL
jgi:hypothetical protein